MVHGFRDATELFLKANQLNIGSGMIFVTILIGQSCYFKAVFEFNKCLFHGIYRLLQGSGGR
jgi:hypothetical protein